MLQEKLIKTQDVYLNRVIELQANFDTGLGEEIFQSGTKDDNNENLLPIENMRLIVADYCKVIRGCAGNLQDHASGERVEVPLNELSRILELIPLPHPQGSKVSYFYCVIMVIFIFIFPFCIFDRYL